MYAATIQSVWEPNLRGILTNRTLRLRIWCTNDERAEYLFFRVSGEEATCDDVEDLCSVRQRCLEPPPMTSMFDYASILCTCHLLATSSIVHAVFRFSVWCRWL